MSNWNETCSQTPVNKVGHDEDCPAIIASWQQRAEAAEAEAKDMTTKAGNLLLRLTEAEKKLAEAQKDTERLTYLEREWVTEGDCPIIECEGNFFAPDSKIRTGGNIRAAIDAARGQA